MANTIDEILNRPFTRPNLPWFNVGNPLCRSARIEVLKRKTITQKLTRGACFSDGQRGQ